MSIEVKYKMASMIEIFCPACENVFHKKLKNYNENVKNNHNNNCPDCAKRIREQKTVDNDLNRLINEAFRRSKKHGRENNITKEYVETLWIKQDGKCAISGLPLEKFLRSIPNTPLTVSIDRIDSSRGYMMDNVQLVCHCINLAKNKYDPEVFGAFIQKLVRQHELNKV